MAEAVRVEATLPGTSPVIAQFSLQMHKKKMFDLENECESDATQHPQCCSLMANVDKMM